MSSGKPRVKLKDIAETANLSVSTVSMALANRPQINEDTKARVRKISQELGYSRSKKLGQAPAANNEGANGRPKRATKRFGYMLVGSSLDDEASMLLAHRLGACASSLGARLELSAVETNVSTVEDFTEQVEAHVVEQTLDFAQGLDGLLLCGYITHNLVKELHKTGMPFVNIGGLMDNGQYLSQPLCDVISSNWLEAGRQAVAKLIEAGHRRIGFFTEQLPRGMNNDLMLQGYKMALLDADMDIDRSCIHVSGRAFTGGGPAAEAMLELAESPTAYLCPDVRIGASFINAMRSHGVDITPNQIVLAGHYELTRKYHVEDYPLVHQKPGVLAEAGLRRLAELWDRPWPSPSIMFLPYATENM